MQVPAQPGYGQFIRFLVVGGGNFVLTFCIYAGLFNVMHLHYLLALAAAWLAGVVVSYLANIVWVFDVDPERRNRTSFAKFMLASGTSVILNAVLLTLLVEGAGQDAFIVQLCLVPLVIAFNFLSAKYWSLRAPASCRRTRV